ncbi:MAG: hypothetical protein B6I37_09430 [Desulfobacteraceae bacterium 4572_35.2]|nr:MAG: hypothetical protein B6I37_09430 [Desulfobacteraceae bacterium 4572_35.2]
MLKRFQLKGQIIQQQQQQQVSYQPAAPARPAPARPATNGWGDTTAKSRQTIATAKSRQTIALDDDEFGKF